MARDYFQRENLIKGLNNAEENDMMLISDLDEIPSREKIKFIIGADKMSILTI